MMDNKEKISELEKRIEILETCPHRCCVCGKPTNGWLKLLFFTRYYCRDHFPIGMSNVDYGLWNKA